MLSAMLLQIEMRNPLSISHKPGPAVRISTTREKANPKRKRYMIRTSRKPSKANAMLSMKKIRFRLPSRAVRDIPNGIRIASKNDPISMPSDKLKGASGLVTVLTSICQNESVLTQSGCVGYVVMRHGRKKPTITSAAPRIPIKLTRRRRTMCEMRHPFTNVFQQYINTCQSYIFERIP